MGTKGDALPIYECKWVTQFGDETDDDCDTRRTIDTIHDRCVNECVTERGALLASRCVSEWCGDTMRSLCGVCFV